MVHPRSRRIVATTLVVTLCIHTVAIHHLNAEELFLEQLEQQGPRAVDTSAQPDGTICGQCVDPRGNAIAEKTLQLLHAGQVVATVQSDRAGHFTFTSPPSGVYLLTDGTSVQSLRIWAPGTAPPAASQNILFVASGPIVAGQVAPLRYWMANPNVMLATAAIAIAVPIIIFNASQDNAAS